MPAPVGISVCGQARAGTRSPTVVDARSRRAARGALSGRVSGRPLPFSSPLLRPRLARPGLAPPRGQSAPGLSDSRAWSVPPPPSAGGARGRRVPLRRRRAAPGCVVFFSPSFHLLLSGLRVPGGRSRCPAADESGAGGGGVSPARAPPSRRSSLRARAAKVCARAPPPLRPRRAGPAGPRRAPPAAPRAA